MQTIKSGDTVVFESTLELPNDTTWTLSGATVYCVIRKGTETFIREAEIVSSVNRMVKYIADIDDDFPILPGRYSQEWKVVFADNTIIRFPNNVHNKFNIKANLE